jgi:hypothetical protein
MIFRIHRLFYPSKTACISVHMHTDSTGLICYFFIVIFMLFCLAARCSTHHHQHIIIRYQRALLSVIVDLGRVLRSSARMENDGVVPPIDILVTVRFAIAVMGARRENASLIRQRYNTVHNSTGLCFLRKA